MPLNYQFYNNTLDDVRREIKRRQDAYWPNGTVNNAALEWNYQKTAYIILKALKVTYTPPSSATTMPFNTFSGAPGSSAKTVTTSTPGSTSITINENAPVKRIQTPTAPILELYGPNYTKSNGTLKGAILNSAEITSEGTYASILRITVNFTVFDKDELDNYMNSFLRPGVDIGLEYGWTVNEFEGNKGDKDGSNPVYVNKGDIYGTVFNFSFSAKEDGTWDCTLHAYGPSMMTYGFSADAKDAENANPDPSNFATYGLLEIFRTVQDNTEQLYTQGDIVTGYCKKAWASQVTQFMLNPLTSTAEFVSNLTKKKGPIFYIYNLPSEFVPGSTSTTIDRFGGSRTSTTEASSTTTPQAYITLNNLIDLINQKINKISKRGLPNYSFTSDNINVCVGTGLNELFLQTGPADGTKFAFTTQRNGEPGSTFQSTLSLRNTTETFSGELIANKNNNIPLQHLVLVNVQFIIDEFNKIISGDKNLQDKKILSFLKSLFKQLETETGGIIDLVMMPERNLNGNITSILILNKTGNPDGALDDIKVFTIPMMTKGSVVRAMSIESKVPDAVVTEVATFTRAGLSYGEDPAGEGVEAASSKQIVKDLIDKLAELNKNYLNNISGNAQQNATTKQQWVTSVRDTYRKLASIQQSLTLNSNGDIGSINNILDLKTAVFPIYLKLTLDGINGFLYGNAIKTNWLPKQYTDPRIYWTVTKIRHMIQNNDWTTELEAIYRVKEK
jgi:hypothetical protein